MIRINLLPREEKVHSEASFNLPKAGEMVLPVMMLVIVALAIGGTALAQRGRIQTLTRSISEVDDQSRVLAPQIARVNRLAQERAELDLRLGIISRLERGRTLSVRLVDQLARTIPDHLWLTAVTQEEENLTVEGATFSMLVISQFVSQLERSTMFSNVELESAEKDAVGGREVVNFHITCRVTPDEPAN
jgi:type IV pilus assembly protein PilN